MNSDNRSGNTQLPAAQQAMPESPSTAAPPSPAAAAAAAFAVGVQSGSSEEDGDVLIPPTQADVAEDKIDAANKLSVEGEQGDRHPPMPPALIADTYEVMNATMKGSLKTDANDNEAPLPPAIVAGADEEMNATMKGSLEAAANHDDTPLPPALTAAGHDEMNANMKGSLKTIDANEDTTSLLPALVTAAHEKMDADIASSGIDALLPPSQASNRAPPTSPQVPLSPPINQGQSPSRNRGQQEQLPVRPTPSSMLLSPDEDAGAASVPASADPGEASAPVLEAMIALRMPSVHMLDATAVEDEVYDAVPVGPKTWLKKNQKFVLGGLVLLLGMGVALGVSFNSNTDTDEEGSSEVLVPSTTQPSESSSPSPVPSSRPTFRPSQSFAPSQYPSFSVHPSLVPSTPPSTSPSKKPSWSFRPSESSTPSETPSLRPSPQPSGSSFPSKSSNPSPQPSTSSPPSTFWSSFNWNQQGQDINGDTSNGLFGLAVAFSADGTTMAVGGPGLPNLRQGYVKVYHREGEGSNWEQRGDTLYGEAEGDQFGVSLSLSNNGKILSIGAAFNDSAGSDSGQVKVFEWDESSTSYKEIGDALYGQSVGDYFGASLDLSSDGKTLAVGAAKQGYTVVYAWDETTSKYTQRGQTITNDWPGISVTLSGDGRKLAIGVPGNSEVNVFAWNEASSSYKQLGDSIVGNVGISVSLSEDGETLAIGAPFDENGPALGQVKIFAWDKATLKFEQRQSLYGKEVEDLFGFSVSLSSDGKTLAIGAPQGFTEKLGFAEVYRWDKVASAYKQLGKRLSGKGMFGMAVALSGDGKALAIGAPHNDENGDVSGEVEIFGIEL